MILLTIAELQKAKQRIDNVLMYYERGDVKRNEASIKILDIITSIR